MSKTGADQVCNFLLPMSRAGSGDVPASVSAFDDIIQNELDAFVGLSDKIGGEVAAHVCSTAACRAVHALSLCGQCARMVAASASDLKKRRNVVTRARDFRTHCAGQASQGCLRGPEELHSDGEQVQEARGQVRGTRLRCGVGAAC